MSEATAVFEYVSEMVCVCVHQYMEKLPDGRTVVRSEAAECRAAHEHELRRQRHVETLLDKLHQEVEKEFIGRNYLIFRSRLPTEGWNPGVLSNVHGLSVCESVCRWSCGCIVAKRLDRSRCHLARGVGWAIVTMY